MGITEYNILEVEDEIERFMDKLNILKKRIESDKSALKWGCKETASLKRASMDLSQALIELRK